MTIVKVVLALFLGSVYLLLLGLGSSVGFGVLLTMTKYSGESDKEYGIYAFWIWTVLATLIVFAMIAAIRYLLMHRYETPRGNANMIAFVLLIVFTITIVASATGVGVAVVRFMEGGF